MINRTIDGVIVDRAITKVDDLVRRLDLASFDQAHVIKDFKATVGKAPAEYAKEIGA